MATITLNAVDYDSFADEAFAAEYLAADVLRAAPWAALQPDDRKRALISATRLLLRQRWVGEVPSLTDTPEVVAQATALLAADIAAKPTLADNGSTSSNVKAVGAGSAKVEFFSPTVGAVLPSAAFLLLRDLLGLGPDDGVGLDNVAYGSSCQDSRFEDRHWSGDRSTLPTERLYW